MSDTSQRTPFIPGRYDDLGLTPTQYRVGCRIARRGECYESLKSIATACKIDRETVQRAVAALIKLGLISQEKRFGRTTIYRFSPSGIGGLGSPDTQRHPGATTQRQRRASHLAALTGYKGSPPKVSPIKEGNAASHGIDTDGAGKNNGKLPAIWQLRKDREELSAAIRAEKEKPNPDQDIIAAYSSDLARVKEQLREHGRLAQGPIEQPDPEPKKPSRNDGTHNANRPANYYDKLVDRQNNSQPNYAKDNF